MESVRGDRTAEGTREPILSFTEVLHGLVVEYGWVACKTTPRSRRDFVRDMNIEGAGSFGGSGLASTWPERFDCLIRFLFLVSDGTHPNLLVRWVGNEGPGMNQGIPRK